MSRPRIPFLPLAAAAIGIALLSPSWAACASAAPGPSVDECEAGVRAAGAGRWEEAEFRWLKALAIDPAAACAHNNLAVLRERQGRPAEARAAYREALEVAAVGERAPVRENFRAFEATQGGGGEAGAPGEEAAETPTVPEEPSRPETPEIRRVRTLEVKVPVPRVGEADLSGFQRILVGNFVVTAAGEAVDLNAVAVRYFRRRIVQRTFFQAVDLLQEPLPAGIEDPLADPGLWVERARRAAADLVLTGSIGLETRDLSRVVRERIRTAAGTLEEVARFRQIVGYRVALRYLMLRGEDGEVLMEGELEGRREFPVDQGVGAEEAVIETLEELLPQLLDAITPKRTEETRVLIY